MPNIARFVPNAAPILTSVPGFAEGYVIEGKARRLTRKKGNNIPLLFIAPSLFCGMAPQLPRRIPGQD